ncbi:hypothetical protein ACJIZ3_024102 [Penstemon smallii]|uniref:Cystatin domain-containing protein n=1 Tax=Penstemon smallii TaxID=265156 RepID=A0ABD3TQV2_9LAMI
MAFKSHSLLVFVLVSILATATFDGVKGIGRGAWTPLQNPNDPHVVEIAKFAVAEHNKEVKVPLVFIKVVKGESQLGESPLVFGVKYRLRISAKDDGGATIPKNYQAVVLEKRGGKEMEAEQDQCTTPRNQEYQIPAALVCPPPPRKKTERRMKRDPPKNGYFQSPELEILFSGAAQRREAWAN